MPAQRLQALTVRLPYSAVGRAQSGGSRATVGARQVDGNTLELVFGGTLTADTLPALWSDMHALLVGASPTRLVLQGPDISFCDSAGVGLLHSLCVAAQRRNIPVDIGPLPPATRRLLDRFTGHDLTPPPAKLDRHDLVAETGALALRKLAHWRDEIVYVGAATLAVLGALRHPLRLRWPEVIDVAYRLGVQAVPLVLLIGFLMGLISAFQAAVPMRMFGADLFVANLLGLSLTRELGPLMAAIVLAGRSGSAFAAELGTMKINEELNALNTMGVDVMRYLVAPRLMAGVLMMPILATLVTAAGIVGGMLVMMSFGFAPTAFMNQMLQYVTYGDFMGGLLKALVFGLLVAAVGCLRGLQTGQGATSVGRSATSAVVTGIVLIAAADGLFAILYYYLGW
jgi:phospholipid/cholesterol/gamma-HCH transport system permease protein